jgi:hypothetical protein
MGLSQYNRIAADGISTNAFRWSEPMPKVLLAKLLLTGSALMSLTAVPSASAQTLFATDQATMVNPDVQLKLTFKGEPPRLGGIPTRRHCPLRRDCRRHDSYLRQAGGQWS